MRPRVFKPIGEEKPVAELPPKGVMSNEHMFEQIFMICLKIGANYP